MQTFYLKYLKELIKYVNFIEILFNVYLFKLYETSQTKMAGLGARNAIQMLAEFHLDTTVKVDKVAISLTQ